MKPYKRIKTSKLGQAKKTRALRFVFVFLTLTILVLIALVIYLTKSIYSLNFSFVRQIKDDGIEVVSMNFKRSSMQSIFIHPDTVLDLPGNKGRYKASSIWKLGLKSKGDNRFVPRVVSYNFLLPVYDVVSSEESTLDYKSKIAVYLVDRGIIGLKHQKFNLQESGFLRQIDFGDGSSGYELSKKILPRSMTLAFVDELSSQMDGLNLHDMSGSASKLEYLSLIVESMGSKIVAYKKGYDSELNCRVTYKSSNEVIFFEKLFGCEIKQEDTADNFILLQIGAKFLNNF